MLEAIKQGDATDGSVAQRIDYDEFGNITQDTQLTKRYIGEGDYENSKTAVHRRVQRVDGGRERSGYRGHLLPLCQLQLADAMARAGLDVPVMSTADLVALATSGWATGETEAG